MNYRFYSDKKTVSLNVPYILSITSSNGLSLKNGSTTLTAKIINIETGDEISYQNSCFQWRRDEQSEDFGIKTGNSIVIDISDLVEGSAIFMCRFKSDDMYFSTESSIIISESIKGEDGWSTTTVQLFKRADTAPERFDGGTLTYTFSTATLSGDFGTWSKTIPTGEGDVFTCFATALSQSDTYDIAPTKWSDPAKISTEGNDGQPGLNVANIQLFQRSENQPSLPADTVTYNFETHTVSNTGLWSNTIPSGTLPLWTTLATASSRAASDIINPAEWSTPVIYAKNGEDGVGIQSITYYYGKSASQTQQPESWSTTLPVLDSEYKYLWSYNITLFTDGSSDESEKGIIGNFSVDGDVGNGIQSITYYYQVSASNSIPPSTWLESVPELTTTNKYLWSYYELEYTNGDTVTSTKSVVGVYGDKGDPGTDAQLLTIASDLPAFHIQADGTPYPDEVATVTVTKQGIEEDTVWDVPNHIIPDDTVEKKFTAYDMGWGLPIRFTNIANPILESSPLSRTALLADYDTITVGHSYYVRTEAEFPTECNSAINYYNGSFYSEIIKDSEYKVNHSLSTMFTPKSWKDGSFLYQEGYDSVAYRTQMTSLKSMLLDITDLLTMFPHFASLSDADKTAILDTLPYAEPGEDVVIGGTLTNDVPAPYEWNMYAGTEKEQVGNETKVTASTENLAIYYNKNYDTTHLYYLRAKLRSESENCRFKLNIAPTNSIASGFNGGINLYDITGEIEESHIDYPTKTIYNPQLYLMNRKTTGIESEVYISNNVLAPDLTSSGWHTMFLLLGFTSLTEIQAWMDANVPYFSGEMDFPKLKSLPVSVSAGTHFASTSIGYVQDGTDGQNGVSITSVKEYYAVSSSNTTAPTEWHDTPPNTTITNKYLWNYEKITYSDGTTSETAKRVIGTYGDTGKGISAITNYYLASASSSGVTTSTSGWTTSIQTVTADKPYLWNYEKVTYTDDTSTTTTPVIIGTYSKPGADAKLLTLSTDNNVFRLKADGTPYDNQKAIVTVNKQGISEDTTFVASNGMPIADNSEEITVTPEMMGFGLPIRLENIANELTGTVTSTARIAEYSNIALGHTYYVRTEAEYAEASRASIGYYNGSIYIGVKGDSSFGTNISLSCIFKPRQWEANAYLYQQGVNSENERTNLTLTKSMVLDVTELLTMFPNFASLSDADKTAILDTLPYAEPGQDVVIGGTLENIAPAIDSGYYRAESNTELTVSSEKLIAHTDTNEPEKPLILSSFSNKNLSKWFISSKVKYTEISDNFTSKGVYIQGKSFLLPSGDSYSWTSNTSKTPKLNEEIKQSWVIEGTPIVLKFVYTAFTPYGYPVTVEMRQPMLCDLVSAGWYTLFKLMGFTTDSQIESWMYANIPYFEDTYDFPSYDTLQITAQAGSYSDAITIGSVRDGQQGEQGTAAKDFSIVSSVDSYTMSSRSYVIKQQTVVFACNKINLDESLVPEWELTVKAGSLITLSATSGNSVTVTIPVGVDETSFKITCTLEGLGTRDITINGIPAGEPAPVYLGIVYYPTDLSTINMTEQGPVQKYDYLLYKDSEGYKYPLYWNGNGWVEITSNTYNYSQIMSTVAGDITKMDGAIKETSATYGWFQNLFSEKASITSMFSQIIQVLGVIYGGGYNADGINTNNNPGFHISALSGLLQAYDAILNGTLKTQDGIGTVIETKKQVLASSYSWLEAGEKKGVVFSAFNSGKLKFENNESFYFPLGNNNLFGTSNNLSANDAIWDSDVYKGMVGLIRKRVSSSSTSISSSSFSVNFNEESYAIGFFYSTTVVGPINIGAFEILVNGISVKSFYRDTTEHGVISDIEVHSGDTITLNVHGSSGTIATLEAWLIYTEKSLSYYDSENGFFSKYNYIYFHSNTEDYDSIADSLSEINAEVVSVKWKEKPEGRNIYYQNEEKIELYESNNTLIGDTVNLQDELYNSLYVYYEARGLVDYITESYAEFDEDTSILYYRNYKISVKNCIVSNATNSYGKIFSFTGTYLEGSGILNGASIGEKVTVTIYELYNRASLTYKDVDLINISKLKQRRGVYVSDIFRTSESSEIGATDEPFENGYFNNFSLNAPDGSGGFLRAENGYTYLPNGMILQWGKINHSTSSNTKTITFLKKFSTIPSLVVTPVSSVNSNVSQRTIVIREDVSNIDARIVFSANTDYGLHWIAIGY